ncbi:MAG TPA: Mur ligase domain-containing protein, partial [Lentimicrobium sp.]|nr:Mur ligase domain-containing protein [Lentimicrobium sp.]
MGKTGYFFSEIIDLLGGECTGAGGNGLIKELLTDSRKLSSPLHTLFFALTTARNDGHRYIRELYEKGVRYFVVSAVPDGNFSEANFLVI